MEWLFGKRMTPEEMLDKSSDAGTYDLGKSVLFLYDVFL